MPGLPAKMHPRRGLTLGILVLAVGALAFVPLPRGCDPRAEELSTDRYRELARFSDTRTRQQIEAAVRLVDPEGALAPYLTITDATLEVRLAPGDREPAVRVALRGSPIAPVRGPRRRIALDPGHSGGAWSEIERRHVSREGGGPVREGDINWATARLVERGLVAQGKEVRLLRGPPPAVPFTIGADARFDLARETKVWLGANHPRIPWLAPVWAFGLWWESRDGAGARHFELYTQYELRRRSAAAAQFGAEVTVSLHHDWCHENSNGIFAFVAGSFLRPELATTSQRFWALQRVLDGKLEGSARLASALALRMMQRLDLPALPPAYVDRHFSGWIPVDPGRGVYARNLAILRRAPGISVVLEGPCMNETQEYQRLQARDLEIDGLRYPSRVRAYADAVVEGLTETSY